MKITQKDINRLNQLDRIEYRLRRDIAFNSPVIIGVFLSCIIFWNFSLLFLTIGLQSNNESFLQTAGGLMLVTMFLGLALLFTGLKSLFNITKINSEYFKQRTEVKKR